MINCIAERLESSGNPDGVRIGGPEFARATEVCAYDTYDTRGHEACLAKYAAKMQKDGKQHLYFAANVNQNHWVVIHINTKKREWEYGCWNPILIANLSDHQLLAAGLSPTSITCSHRFISILLVVGHDELAYFLNPLPLSSIFCSL